MTNENLNQSEYDVQTTTDGTSVENTGTPETTLPGEASENDNYETLVLPLTVGYYNYQNGKLELTKELPHFGKTTKINCCPGDKFRITGTSQYELALAVFFQIDSNENINNVREEKVVGCFGIASNKDNGESFTNKQIVVPVNCNAVAFQTSTNSTLKVEKYIGNKLNYNYNANDKITYYHEVKPRDFLISSRYDMSTQGFIKNTTTAIEKNGVVGWQSLVLPCSKGDVFRISGYIPTSFKNSNVAIFINKDSNMKVLSCIYRDDYSCPMEIKNKVVIAPDEATHVIFNSFHSNKPEGYDLRVEKYIITDLKDDLYGNIINPYYSDPLFGKSMYIDGDSIAQGPYFNSTLNVIGTSYGTLISRYHNMAVVNNAKSGTTIARHAGNGTYLSIYERVTNMKGQYDFILLEGGWNDLFKSVDRGSLLEGTNHEVYNPTVHGIEPGCKDNKFDPWTTIGAVEAICKFLTEEYSDTPKLFVLGHRKAGNLFNQNNYWEDIKSALNKWNFPYIDLRDKNNFAGWNDELNNAYFKRELVFDNTTNTYFYEVGDGTHPNIKGYDLFYVPYIEESLKSLYFL